MEEMKEVRRLFLPASKAGRIGGAALEHALDQVAELLGGELISFEIGRQPSLTIDDQRVQRMNQLSFIREKGDAESFTEFLDFCGRAGQKVPTFRVKVPRARVLGERFRLVMDGVEADGQQNQVAAHFVGKPLLQSREVIRQPKAKIREWAARVNKADGHDFSGELRTCDTFAILIGERKVRRRLPNPQDVIWRKGLVHRSVEQSQSARR